MTVTLTPHQRTALARWAADPDVGTPVTADVAELLDWARDHAPLTGMQLFALLVGGAHCAGTIIDVVDSEGLATASAIAANTVEAFVYDRAHLDLRRASALEIVPDWRWRQLLNFARYTVNGHPMSVTPRLSHAYVVGSAHRAPSGLTVGTTSLPLALLWAHLKGHVVFQTSNVPQSRLKGLLSQCSDEHGCLNSRIVLDASGVKWRSVDVDSADSGEIEPCRCTEQPLVNLGGDEDLLDLFDQDGRVV